jgi:hypothetical protein
MIDHYDGNGEEVGGSDVSHISTIVHSNKRQARPSTDHFKRLLEEVYPNHTYPIRHNSKIAA